MTERRASLTRSTKETEVSVSVDLDGRGRTAIDTGIAFFDHMLDQLGRHGLFDLEIHARGDLAVDFHHTVEDVGLALGQAFDQALGERRGIMRFASRRAPLDEALAECVVDLSGRGGLWWTVAFSQAKIRDFDAPVLREFFAAFARDARCTLHLTRLSGENAHHEAESLFKAAALALGEATRQDPRRQGAIPSTKERL